jgi:DNA-binding CsgD family transcriptional regulator
VSIPSFSGNPPVLVGRGRELAALRQHLDAAIDGRGGLVLVGGEAGIGKTVLAEALCREAAERGALVLVGRCYDLTETPPYGPWVELFGRYRPGESDPTLPAAFAVRGTVGEVMSQAALIQQVLDFFSALAATRPVVLLLDDLHWADPASLDVLRPLARSLAAQPLLVLATYRSDELTRRHPLYPLLPLLVREAHAARLDLHPLDAPALTALVSDRYRLPDAETARLTSYLTSRAEGNALFVGELLRSLEEGGALVRDGEAWRLGDLGEAAVPPLLRQVIDGRVARLDAESQRLLAIAAVVGHETSLHVWATVAATGEETVLAAIAEADAAHLMVENGDGVSATFTHALIREALYEGIRPSQRRRWHRAIGEVLAAHPQPDPDAVAYHFQQAGDGRAVTWLVAAGDRAQRVWAWLAAANRIESAVGLLASLGGDANERGWLHFRLAMLRRYGDPLGSLVHLGTAARLARETDDALLGAQARFYRGNITCLAGNPGLGVAEMDEGIQALAALPAFDAASRPGIEMVAATEASIIFTTWLGNVGRFAEARLRGERLIAAQAARPPNAVNADAQVRHAFAGLAQVYAYLGEAETARQGFADAMAVNNALGHHLLVGVNLMYALQWEVLAYRGDAVSERRRLAKEAEDAWTRGGGARGAIPARFTRTAVLFVEGEWDEMRPLALAGYTESDTYALVRLFAFANLGPLAHAQGDAELANTLLDDWLPDGPATAPGETFYAATILQRVAAALAIERGDLETGHAWLEALDRWLTWSEAVLGQAERHLAWAHYHRAAGNAVTARQHAERALTHACEPRQPLALLAAHRLVGQLDTDAGRYDDATEHLAASLTLADACQAPYERALTLLAQAESRAATGERGAAHGLIDEVRPVFASLGARPALARADAVAARLAIVPAPPAYPAGLSEREVQVLRLVVEGLSNRAIADRLFLSARTVQVHLAHIFAKTGAENRAAATAFALRHHLA